MGCCEFKGFENKELVLTANLNLEDDFKDISLGSQDDNKLDKNCFVRTDCTLHQRYISISTLLDEVDNCFLAPSGSFCGGSLIETLNSAKFHKSHKKHFNYSMQ